MGHFYQGGPNGNGVRHCLLLRRIVLTPFSDLFVRQLAALFAVVGESHHAGQHERERRPHGHGQPQLAKRFRQRATQATIVRMMKIVFRPYWKMYLAGSGRGGNAARQSSRICRALFVRIGHDDSDRSHVPAGSQSGHTHARLAVELAFDARVEQSRAAIRLQCARPLCRFR